jgi:hypothetical protein
MSDRTGQAGGLAAQKLPEPIAAAKLVDATHVGAAAAQVLAGDGQFHVAADARELAREKGGVTMALQLVHQ